MNMLNSNDHPGKTFFFAKPEIRHNNIINWDWVENAWPDSGSLFLNVLFAILMYGLICPLNRKIFRKNALTNYSLGAVTQWPAI